MKKKILIPLLIIAGIIIAIIVYSASSDGDKAILLTTNVENSDFEIAVTITGELQAEKSVEITAPYELRSRNLRIRSIKIQRLIPEGTVVDSGDWVATLDRSEADNSLKDVIDELETTESEFTRSRLDTTIQLRQLRDDLINLRFNVEEMKIALEQSKFEPPATIRQAQINLDKAERSFEQASKNYSLKVEQARADMTEVTLDLAQDRRTKDEMTKVLEGFDIYAPAPGMVIYKREWNGQKRTVGSEINTWDLAVATLPDLSTLVSKTYVNEIDVSKIKIGQNVRIGVDAFPEKKFTGVVTEVANIGEQLPNTDAKVFEVAIRLIEKDSILRPSMTTSNQIITRNLTNVLHVPLESVHSNDSMTFVYTTKNVKQIVLLGESNENSIIIKDGLSAGDELYLSIPDNSDMFRLHGLEIYEVIKQSRAEEEKRKNEEQKIFEQKDDQENGTRTRQERRPSQRTDR